MSKGGNSDDLIQEITGMLRGKSRGELLAIRDRLSKKPSVTIAKDYLGKTYDIRLNTILDSWEYRQKGKTKYEKLNQYDLHVELQEVYRPLGSENLKAILRSSFIPQHNPFLEYFENLPTWEKGGQDYISELAGYVQTADQERWLYHFKKHLVRSVACALRESVYNKQCLTLTSGQNDGKSTFCRFLCPPALSDHKIENPSPDKDGEIALTENFLVNLDELKGLKRSELEALKSFFSKDRVNVRRPYAATSSRATRVANFFGSTNETEFLTDPTGSVRWLCFEVKSIDFGYSKKVDIDLVWAQAYALLESGFEYELTKEDTTENERINKKYQVYTPEMDLIAKNFKPLEFDDFDESDSNHVKLSSTEVIDLFGDDAKNQRLSSVRIGKGLSFFGFKSKAERVGKKGMPVKVWYIERHMVNQDYEPIEMGDIEEKEGEFEKEGPGGTRSPGTSQNREKYLTKKTRKNRGIGGRK